MTWMGGGSPGAGAAGVASPVSSKGTAGGRYELAMTIDRGNLFFCFRQNRFQRGDEEHLEGRLHQRSRLRRRGYPRNQFPYPLIDCVAEMLGAGGQRRL